MWQAKNSLTASKSLDDFGEDLFDKKRKALPAGYAACTRVALWGKFFDVLLDYGATVSAIPEEILLVILAMCSEKDIEDPLYPVVELHRYEEPGTLYL